jgi:hypothetical protein
MKKVTLMVSIQADCLFQYVLFYFHLILFLSMHPGIDLRRNIPVTNEKELRVTVDKIF